MLVALSRIQSAINPSHVNILSSGTLVLHPILLIFKYLLKLIWLFSEKLIELDVRHSESLWKIQNPGFMYLWSHGGCLDKTLYFYYFYDILAKISANHK